MPDQAAPQRPSAAGMYDYYLGGTAHSPLDRAAGERMVELMPDIKDGAWASRGFLQRAVHWLAAQHGVRQFLDIGAGLPTASNTHDVVAEVIPDGRVYVDADPAAVARGRQLLAGTDRAVMIEGDVRDPDAILTHPETRRLIDFTEPVGLLMVALLQFVPDEADPVGMVARYLDAVPSGSYLALSHGTGDQITERARRAATAVYASSRNPATERSKTEIERFFTGLEIVPPYAGAEPGLVFAGLWAADDPSAADTDGSRLSYAAVGRKP